MTCLSDAHLTTCVGQTPPPKIAIVDRPCFKLYKVVTHIFEGLSKSFMKIFSPLIEEKFYKIAVSDYY